MKRFALSFFLFIFFASSASAAVTWSSNFGTNTNSPLNNGLVGYWTFDANKVVAAVALDLSTQNRSGTLTNGPLKVPGKLGQALQFDGVNDFVDMTAAGAVDSRDDFSTSFWFVSKAIGTFQGLVYFVGSSGASTDFLAVGLKNGKILASGDDSNGASKISPSLSSNVWYHVVVTKTAGQVNKVYINGLDVTVAGNDFLGGSTARSIVGGSFNGGSIVIPHNGFIDDVRIYNRVLSANEAVTLYKIGAAQAAVASRGTAATSGLAAYYPMDASDIAPNGVVFDRKNTGASKINGTLVGGVTKKTGLFGQALSFDGSTGYVDLPTGSFGSLVNNLTVAAWVKPNALPATSRIVSAARTAGSNGIGFGFSGKKQFFTTFGVKDYIGAADVGQVGVWQHVAAVMGSDNTITFYFNGKRQDSITHGSPGVANTDDHFFIGMSTDSDSATLADGCNCLIDELRLYERALSDKEIADLYNQPKSQVLNANDTNVLTRGLVLNQTFNGSDMTATVALDRSGSGNHGALTGGPIKSPGKVGQALKFNGTNQRVSIPTTGFPAGSNAPFTLSAWVNIPQLTSQFKSIITYGVCSTSGASAALFTTDTNKWRISTWGTGNDLDTSASITPKKWTHVVGVGSGGQLFLYVDGVLAAGPFTPSSYSLTPTRANIGADCQSTPSFFFNGNIDEVRVYNRALSHAEVQSLYAAGN